MRPNKVETSRGLLPNVVINFCIDVEYDVDDYSLASFLSCNLNLVMLSQL